mmetsp:Transcript_25448/g.43443  ORF Transcript_25448/g.43443 Transcript_25448/m.43443 type:complete len:220 (+) Transcript_25448:428-1087(+)
MAQRHGFRFARGTIHSADILSPRARLNCCAQELDGGGPSVPLVPAHFVTRTTQRSQCTLSQHHILQNALGIRPLHAGIINDASTGCVYSLSCVLFNLTPLVDRRCAVNDKGEGVCRGNAPRERIGSHHWLDAKGWCDRWSGVGSCESNTSLISSHGCIVSCNAIVRRIPTCHKPHPMLLRLINRHLHTMRSNIQPNSQIPIHQRGSITLTHNINGFFRE